MDLDNYQTVCDASPALLLGNIHNGMAVYLQFYRLFLINAKKNVQTFKNLKCVQLEKIKK